MQVNLQAGPERGWPERVARAYRLGPTLVAISASSPWLNGRDTGWKSARQRAWSGLDARACGPVPGCLGPGAASDAALDPASAWARYAMRAPVAFVRAGGDEIAPVLSPVPFERWASGRGPPGRARPDRRRSRHPPDHAVPAGPAARLPRVAVPGHDRAPVVAGHRRGRHDAHGRPRRADLATEATEQTAGLWTRAARDGLRDAALRRLRPPVPGHRRRARPGPARPAVADLAELVESGRCPGDLLAERIAEIGPHAAFEELAHA